MQVLLINQTFYPDQSATAQYLTDLARALRDSGDEVTVLTSAEGYLDRAALYPARERFEGIEIVRVRPIFSSRRGRIRRIIGALMMNLALAVRMRLLPRSDVTVVLTSPPLIAWLAAYWGKRPRRGLCFWVMDLNPDQAIAAGWIGSGSLIARVLNSALRGVLRRARWTVTLDRFMAERLVAKGGEPSRIFALPLWYGSELHPIARQQNQFRAEHKLQEAFVVMYSGNLSICHPLDTVLEAARRCRDDRGVEFLFIGGGERVEEVLEFKRLHKLENIRYLPYVPREQLTHSLAAADLHLISFGTPYIGMVHPSKIYGIVAVARPFLLIGPAQSFIAEDFVDQGIGQRVEHGDVDGLLAAIARQRSLTDAQREAQSAQILPCASRFSITVRCAALVDLLHQDRAVEGAAQRLVAHKIEDQTTQA